jgi:hypothetical protein
MVCCTSSVEQHHCLSRCAHRALLQRSSKQLTLTTAAVAIARCKLHAQMFKEDVIKSGGGRSKEPLVDLVVNRSYPDGVEWLMMPNFGLNLTQLAHCGGHSAPRTHRYKQFMLAQAFHYVCMYKYAFVCAANHHGV